MQPPKKVICYLNIVYIFLNDCPYYLAHFTTMAGVEEVTGAIFLISDKPRTIFSANFLVYVKKKL